MSPVRHELRALSRLAWPLVLTNVGWMLIGTVDTLMLGWLSKEALAASLLGNVWVHLTQITAMGILLGMDPLVTQAHGRRDRRGLGLALQRGVVLAVLIGIPLIATRFLTADVLELFRRAAERIGGPDAAAGFDPGLAADAERYAIAQTFAAPFFLLYIAQRQFLQGRGILRPALIVTLAAIALNAVLNGILIFGLDLGLVGAGAASALTRVFLAVGLFLAIRRFELLRGAWIPWSRDALRGLGTILRYGIPVGAHFGLEVGAFAMSTLLAGLLGVVATAAHGIALNVASLTFMMPLGVSLAAVTRVGNLLGEGRRADAQRAAWTAVGLGAGLMALGGAALALLRNWIPTLYNGDPAVIALAATIFPVAATFQVVDGIQVVAGGVLRGAGRTLPPAVFNLIAWYGLALPLAWIWGIERGHGVVGVWWALATGLAGVAVALVLWIARFGPAYTPQRGSSEGIDR